METVKRTGVLRSERQWHESNLNLSKYLQVGDAVDEALQSYFLEVLFPAHFDSTMTQMGEPHDHNGANGQARFATIQKHPSGAWIYTGLRTRRERVQFL